MSIRHGTDDKMVSDKDFGQPTFDKMLESFEKLDLLHDMPLEGWDIVGFSKRFAETITDEEREALHQKIETDIKFQGGEQEERERILTTGNHVWMLSVPYEGFYTPAFSTEEACREYWADMMSVDDGVRVCLIEVIE